MPSPLPWPVCVRSGPVAEILPFFADQLGYVCPVRKDSGSFLQEVTTPVGQYAYASPALLQKKGLCQADCDPMKARSGGGGVGLGAGNTGRMQASGCLEC